MAAARRRPPTTPPAAASAAASIELPGIVRTFAEIIGEGAAAQLLITYGGKQLYVPLPHGLKTSGELVRAIGEVAARKLVKTHGGNFFYIPAAKRVRILLLLQEGATREAIANAVGCTERYVYTVKKQFEEDGGQITVRSRSKRRRRKKARPLLRAPAPDLSRTVRPQLDLFFQPLGGD